MVQTTSGFYQLTQMLAIYAALQRILSGERHFLIGSHG